jgi:hypothetical protein
VITQHRDILLKSCTAKDLGDDYDSDDQIKLQLRVRLGRTTPSIPPGPAPHPPHRPPYRAVFHVPLRGLWTLNRSVAKTCKALLRLYCDLGPYLAKCQKSVATRLKHSRRVPRMRRQWVPGSGCIGSWKWPIPCFAKDHSARRPVNDYL